MAKNDSVSVSAFSANSAVQIKNILQFFVPEP